MIKRVWEDPKLIFGRIFGFVSLRSLKPQNNAGDLFLQNTGLLPKNRDHFKNPKIPSRFLNPPQKIIGSGPKNEDRKLNFFCKKQYPPKAKRWSPKIPKKFRNFEGMRLTSASCADTCTYPTSFYCEDPAISHDPIRNEIADACDIALPATSFKIRVLDQKNSIQKSRWFRKPQNASANSFFEFPAKNINRLQDPKFSNFGGPKCLSEKQHPFKVWRSAKIISKKIPSVCRKKVLCGRFSVTFLNHFRYHFFDQIWSRKIQIPSGIFIKHWSQNDSKIDSKDVSKNVPKNDSKKMIHQKNDSKLIQNRDLGNRPNKNLRHTLKILKFWRTEAGPEPSRHLWLSRQFLLRRPDSCARPYL